MGFMPSRVYVAIVNPMSEGCIYALSVRPKIYMYVANVSLITICGVGGGIKSEVQGKII